MRLQIVSLLIEKRFHPRDKHAGRLGFSGMTRGPRLWLQLGADSGTASISATRWAISLFEPTRSQSREWLCFLFDKCQISQRTEIQIQNCEIEQVWGQHRHGCFLAEFR